MITQLCSKLKQYAPQCMQLRIYVKGVTCLSQFSHANTDALPHLQRTRKAFARSSTRAARTSMTHDINLLLVYKLQQYQVRVPMDITFAQLKVEKLRKHVVVGFKAEPSRVTQVSTAACISYGCLCCRRQHHCTQAYLHSF